MTVIKLDQARGETWECTMQLRYARAPVIEDDHLIMGKQLQQLWICRELGKTEWKDVPNVDVE
jgi:hypothetical protein